MCIRDRGRTVWGLSVPVKWCVFLKDISTSKSPCSRVEGGNTTSMTWLHEGQHTDRREPIQWRVSRYWRATIQLRSRRQNFVSTKYVCNICELWRSLYVNEVVDFKGQEMCIRDRPWGLNQFKVMPFGVKNTPDTIMHLMDQVLSASTGEFCKVYLDDIMIYSKNRHEHLSLIHI